MTSEELDILDEIHRDLAIEMSTRPPSPSSQAECAFSHKGDPEINVRLALARMETMYRPRYMQGSLHHLRDDGIMYLRAVSDRDALVSMLMGIGACIKCCGTGSFKDALMHHLKTDPFYLVKGDGLPFAFRRPEDRKVMLIEFDGDDHTIRKATAEDVIVGLSAMGYRPQKGLDGVPVDGIPLLDLEEGEDDDDIEPLYVSQTLRAWMGMDDDDIQYLADFIRSAMDRDHTHDQILYLDVASGGGKGTLMDILIKMFGGRSRAARHATRLGRFDLATYEQALLVIFNEADPSDGDVNALVGATDSTQDLERKYKDSYQARLPSKFVMLSTHAPGENAERDIDWDKGLFRRLRILAPAAKGVRISDPSIKRLSKMAHEVDRFTRWVLRVGRPSGVYRETRSMRSVKEDLILEQNPEIGAVRHLLRGSKGDMVVLRDFRDYAREQLNLPSDWATRLQRLRSALTAEGYKIVKVSAKTQYIMHAKTIPLEDKSLRRDESLEGMNLIIPPTKDALDGE